MDNNIAVSMLQGKKIVSFNVSHKNKLPNGEKGFATGALGFVGWGSKIYSNVGDEKLSRFVKLH